MIWKIIDLETETTYLFKSRSFFALIEVNERNFNNRWRDKKTKGLSFGHKFYVTEININE